MQDFSIWDWKRKSAEKTHARPCTFELNFELKLHRWVWKLRRSEAMLQTNTMVPSVDTVFSFYSKYEFQFQRNLHLQAQAKFWNFQILLMDTFYTILCPGGVHPNTWALNENAISFRWIERASYRVNLPYSCILSHFTNWRLEMEKFVQWIP